MLISSQAQRWEGSETTKYKYSNPAYSKGFCMNSKDRAILYGLAVGDGHISHRTRYKDQKYKYITSELILGHGPKQLMYLEYKANLIQKVLGGSLPKISKVRHTLKATGKTYEGYRVAKTAKYFRQMHRVLYTEDKKKRITGQVLSYMDNHSLALWYMDDGSIYSNRNKAGEITSLSFRICTQVPKDEAEWIVEWLNDKFGIKAKYFLTKKSGKYDIGGATQATLCLVNAIQDYVEPSMMYKIAPAFKFVFRKSAHHPNFKVDDDIVRSMGKPIEVED